MVLKIISNTYTLFSLAKRIVGIRIAAKMISPPIVGVPFLDSSPSNPNVLIVSAA